MLCDLVGLVVIGDWDLIWLGYGIWILFGLLFLWVDVIG